MPKSKSASKSQSKAQAVETLYDGRFINMARRGTWEYASRKGLTGIVGIVAVTDAGELILIEQHRPPVNARVIELPAGLAGDIPGSETEKLAHAAKRELLEETGYTARGMKHLATGVSSAGICDEVITLFLATGLRKVGDGAGDGSENIVTHLVPLDRVQRWLSRQARQGKLIDLKIYGALHFAGQI